MKKSPRSWLPTKLRRKGSKYAHFEISRSGYRRPAPDPTLHRQRKRKQEGCFSLHRKAAPGMSTAGFPSWRDGLSEAGPGGRRSQHPLWQLRDLFSVQRFLSGDPLHSGRPPRYRGDLRSVGEPLRSWEITASAWCSSTGRRPFYWLVRMPQKIGLCGIVFKRVQREKLGIPPDVTLGVTSGNRRRKL